MGNAQITSSKVGRDLIVTVGSEPADSPSLGLVPSRPPLFIGREQAMSEIKSRLAVGRQDSTSSQTRQLTVIRGWPGVGKTTLTSAITHDAEIVEEFSDGIFWVSLGQRPDLLAALSRWARAMGMNDVAGSREIDEISHRIARKTQGKRMLFLVDDVWESADFLPFSIASNGSAVIVTTRLNRVAHELASSPPDIFKLEVLDQSPAMTLFRTLAPSVVKSHPSQCAKLVDALEGLPLAIQVAARMLEAEILYGFTAVDLLCELSAGQKLLEGTMPGSTHRDDLEISPSVSALLRKSTDRLNDEDRDRYAYLSAFAPKPATFDLKALAAVWQVTDARPTVRALVDRGLLEPISNQRFQMHALLVMHASTLCSVQSNANSTTS